MLKYYDFSGVSFLVDKRFKCENASENGRPPFCPAGVAYNLGNGGVPVHHDPVDGIFANPGNREWEPL